MQCTVLGVKIHCGAEAICSGKSDDVSNAVGDIAQMKAGKYISYDPILDICLQCTSDKNCTFFNVL